MPFKPVLFLAFANDKVDQTAYLRNLSAEMHGIRKALGEAVSSGLCEVVERSSASVGDILDVFQDPVFASRISLFHYGGHANGFSLLLESEDGTKALAHKEGLVPFLSRQENLKLVFLNGCSSEGQAADLLKAGISAVIGTTSAINDEVATSLAIRFYSSLGDGSGIEKAWADATDEVKISKGTGNTRALLWEGKNEASEHFPWVIRFRPGAEIIKEWNLPDISGNPLYGLPDIPPSFNLPESPFLYLNRYERRHAEVFFGRSYYIRSLFSSVHEAQAPPIILLYGQSGVGKSSLLEAGLQPRLESRFEILYLRRSGALGLSATVYNALLEKCGFKPEVSTISMATKDSDRVLDELRNIAANIEETFKPDVQQLIQKIAGTNATDTGSTTGGETPPSTLSEAWKQAEAKLNKPLVIILDQLEEAYTRPNERLGNEMNQWFIHLKAIFGNPALMPQGKIILSFRKEYHPEIEEYCKNYELPRSKIFLEHITKRDVLDVFRGFMETPRLKSRYNLQVEDGLPEIIAADLAADKDSPIAPMLQILLTKLWIKSLTSNPEAPAFTHALYRDLKEEGLAMDEFLQNQLNALKKKFPELHHNGFALEVLGFYCTPNGTSAARTEQQLVENYPDAVPEIRNVLAGCMELFLITDLGGVERSAMLAHDTLAKSVVKLQQRSARPLQQARRVLHSRMEAVRGGSASSTLDHWDLKLIDGVLKYLPAVSGEEKNLIEASRKAVLKKEKEKVLLKYSKRGLAAITGIGALLIGLLYFQSRAHAKASFVNHMAAASAINLRKDPTLSLMQAAEGMKVNQENSIAEIKKSLTDAFYSAVQNRTPWYDTVFSTDLNYYDLVFHENEKTMIPFTETDSLEILDYDGNLLGALVTDPLSPDDPAMAGAPEDAFAYFTGLKWNRDGHSIVALNSDGILQFHEASGSLKKRIGMAHEYQAFDVSPVLNQAIAYAIGDSQGYAQDQIRLFDMDGNLLKSFGTTADIKDIRFTADGKNVLLTRFDTLLTAIDQAGLPQNPEPDSWKKVEILNLDGMRIRQLDAKEGEVLDLWTSPSGKWLATVHAGGTLVLWTSEGRRFNTFKPPVLPGRSGMPGTRENEILHIDFHPNDSLMAICFRQDAACLYPIYGKSAAPVMLWHEHLVTFARFSEDGRRVLTGSADNTAAVWDLKGNQLYHLLGHKNDVTGGKFIDQGEQVLTTSLDGTVRRWVLENYPDLQFTGHRGAVTYIDLDPLDQYLVSAGVDHTMRVWDIKSKREVDRLDLGDQGVRYAIFTGENEILGMGVKNQAFLYKLFEATPVKFIGHTGPVEWAGAIGDHIVTASKDGSIRYWNKTGKEVKRIEPGQGEMLSLIVSQQDSIVAAGSESGTIFLFDEKGEVIAELEGHRDAVIYLNVSDDGSRLVSTSRDGTAIIWDLKSKSEVARLDRIACAPYQDCQVNSASFSSDGSRIVTTSSDRTIRLWDSDGNLKASMVGHTGEVVDAFFTPNDDMIYSFSADQTLRLWDFQGKEIIAYRGHTGKINCAYMDFDMNQIFTASEDGTIRAWLSPIGVYRWMRDSKQFKPIFHGKYNQ
ncbi:MAG TPA: AAA family ATPase [Saprospiraceae bacterium]|nr:AAA family ATPase [Saprospiraceae bacterium]HNT21169.1 AAA family ATPase [Saprospiraceae bacterium]